MTTGATHIVQLGGESAACNPDNYQEVCEELVKKHGGVPVMLTLSDAMSKGLDVAGLSKAMFSRPSTVVRMPVAHPLAVAPKASVATVQAKPVPAPIPVATKPASVASVVAAVPTPVAPITTADGVSITGAVRAAADEEGAKKAGFSMAQPLYTLGRLVNATGVENARSSRLEFDNTPKAQECCSAFMEQIKKEDRKDIMVSKRDICMSSLGKLVLNHKSPDERRLMLTDDSFASLCMRLGIGGSDYLSKCWPELRAMNINQWAKYYGAKEDINRAQFQKNPPRKGRGRAKTFTPDILNIRTRMNANVSDREVYGIVTDSYAPFNVDKVAEALLKAVPADARGTVTYDGKRARFEVLFHSDVAPEEYVAGEVFKAGVVIKTADDGSGGLRVSSVVWRNLCLNLLIIDEAGIPIANLRHIGDVNELVKKFHVGFDDALKRLEYFQKAWGFAAKENVVERSDATTSEDIAGLSIEEALPGLFNGLILRDMVPVRGYSRKDAVKHLVAAYDRDPVSSASPIITRTGIVNALSRFAHEDAQADVWVEDDLQEAAGALLFGRKDRDPDPIPYAPFDEEEAEESA